jgi:hypothetical protein
VYSVCHPQWVVCGESLIDFRVACICCAYQRDLVGAFPSERGLTALPRVGALIDPGFEHKLYGKVGRFAIMRMAKLFLPVLDSRVQRRGRYVQSRKRVITTVRVASRRNVHRLETYQIKVPTDVHLSTPFPFDLQQVVVA